jgi:hypothetical protein
MAGEMVSEKARAVIERFGYSKLIDAWGHQPPTILTLHNYPTFLTHVEIPSAHTVTEGLGFKFWVYVQAPSISGRPALPIRNMSMYATHMGS